MNIYIKCCPFCGCEILLDFPKTYCIDCTEYDDPKVGKEREITPYVSEHPKEYYEGISLKQYNTTEKWKSIFVETELSKQPLFSSDRYEFSIERQKERDERKAYMESHPEEFKPYAPPQPECPTCHSTDVKRISDARKVAGALMFGIFSKTAKSQFQCNNCGYKW